MLQHTPAADAEVGALRLNAVRRCTQQAREPPLVERRRGSRTLPVHALAGQGIVDEDGLAVDVCDPPTLVIEIRDLRSFRDELRCLPSRPQQSGSRHAARISWKCGFGCARSASRTRASSSKYSSRFIRPRINWKRQKTRKVLSTSVSQ